MSMNILVAGATGKTGQHLVQYLIDQGHKPTALVRESSAKGVDELYETAIDADAIARAIAFAIEQPADVDVNELIIRPTKQPL